MIGRLTRMIPNQAATFLHRLYYLTVYSLAMIGERYNLSTHNGAHLLYSIASSHESLSSVFTCMTYQRTIKSITHTAATSPALAPVLTTVVIPLSICVWNMIYSPINPIRTARAIPPTVAHGIVGIPSALASPLVTAPGKPPGSPNVPVPTLPVDNAPKVPSPTI